MRRLYGAKFEVPQALRDGAIAHRFGPGDIDAIHAAKLKAVQNAAFLRAAWMANAVANDLDISDPRPRWAMYVNGIAEDLHAARVDAAQAGVDSAAIDDADKIGSSGLAWDQQPAHRLLGRLEDLSHELYRLGNHNAEQAEQIRNLTQRLETAEAAIDDLGDTVSRQEVSLRELLGEVDDHHWINGRAEAVRELDSLAKLRHANTVLATANVVDALDAADPAEHRPQTGADIGTAVEVAMTGADPPIAEDPSQPATPLTEHPHAAPEGELEP
ncbi:hypothetical protein KHQ06_24525 [Nocardia tengchongensis]|uniref:ESX-1 secretion-associated protein EspA/EspE-like domain-containing protein n=1 Tax=Nocardia tengchongensis TaxID=2055889 RepID=A0ABX8CHV9_9NOCA|nr:hypothetical protein [Nocardia tengchongensis]QVI19528.1 hypothetical protein KHQ06_24525 [Nocardia tengchongensis]